MAASFFNLLLHPFESTPTAGDGGVWLSFGVLAGVATVLAALIRRDIRRSGQSAALYATFRLLWLFCKLLHGVRPRGGDPLPKRGPAIVISNHTSPCDPLYLHCNSDRVISFLMAREYYHVRVLRPIFALNGTILVNRTGRDTAATKAAIRALREGRVIGIFPEGGIHIDPATLGDGKQGAAMLALMTRVPVIPAFIDRPRHTNKIADAVLRPAPTRVIYGKPIDLAGYYEKGHNHEVLDEVTQVMMRSIDELRPRRAAARA